MPGTQRTQRTYPRYVTREEFEKMFPHRVALTNPRDYVLFLCVFSLWLRNTEARTLRLKHFKQVKEVKEAEEADGDVYLEVRGKGAKDRTVWVPPEVWEMIQRYAKSQGIRKSDWLSPPGRAGPSRRGTSRSCAVGMRGPPGSRTGRGYIPTPCATDSAWRWPSRASPRR